MNGESLINMNSREVRNQKILRLPLGVLADLLRLDGTSLVKLKGFPKDGRIVAANHNQHTNELNLTVESRSEFKEVEEGSHLSHFVLTASVVDLKPPE